jgi:stage II sporulation protein AA (anti-sigma F factor antagonist)
VARNGASASDGLRWHFASSLIRKEHRVILTLSGRIGYSAVAALDGVLAAVLQPAPRVAIVDLSAVDYVSGAGATRLAGLAAALASSGGSLVLCGLHEPVRQVLTYVGVLSQAAVEETREEALKRQIG